MNIIEIIKEEVENFEYRGDHSAPSPNGDDKPMYDVDEMFPDIYGNNAIRLFGIYGDNDDAQAINIIQSARNRPNYQVRIYRAVPNINSEIDVKAKEISYLINYYHKYRFFPPNNKKSGDIEDEVWNNNPTFTYDEMMKGTIEKLYEMFNELQKQKQKSIKINNGDWVTIVRNYAAEHGAANLNNNYKIITKTVSARDLYSEGNSIMEWGYYKL